MEFEGGEGLTAISGHSDATLLQSPSAFVRIYRNLGSGLLRPVKSRSPSARDRGHPARQPVRRPAVQGAHPLYSSIL
jgi:hypothetical protein